MASSDKAQLRLNGLNKQLGSKLSLDKSSNTTMAAHLEEALAQAVKVGKIPHAIVYATNKDGSKQYHHATGFQHYGVNDEPIQEDAVLMLASQTKLLTSIAGLQVVEQGLIGLDEDVCSHLPELGAQPILQSFDEDDKPKFKQRKNPITLRQLLSHSSGATYAFLPDVMKYDGQKGRTHPETSMTATLLDRCNTPLVAEPGESWMYSTGIDWAGLLIERLTSSSLEDFMVKYLWQPLGITGITFWPKNNSELKDKVPGIAVRTPEGKLAPFTDDTINTHSTDCFGGHGAYAKMGDYLEVLRSLLANDGRLLKAETVDMMFEPQLGEGSAKAFTAFRDGAFGAMMIGEHNNDIPINHGLGGMLFLKDDVGRRKKGTLSWGGMVNPFWLVDREAGIALTFGTQVLPPGDAGCKETIGVVERAVYEMFGVE